MSNIDSSSIAERESLQYLSTSRHELLSMSDLRLYDSPMLLKHEIATKIDVPMERKAGGKRKWWLLLLVGLGLMGWIGLSLRVPNPYPFIAEHNGKEIAEPSTLRIGFVLGTPTHYAFSDEPANVRASVKAFARARGWKWQSVDYWTPNDDWAPSISFWNLNRLSKQERDENHIRVPTGTTCVVTVVDVYRETWLERQWTVVKRWFGS